MVQRRDLVILTRPRKTSELLSLKLSDMGVNSHICPILERRFIRCIDWPLPNNLQALVLTSANAVAALQDSQKIDAYSHLPCFCVGAQTAKAAMDNGFSTVYVSDSGVDGVVSDITTVLSSEQGGIFYPRGRDAAHDIAGILKTHGFSCVESVVYAMEERRHLPDDFQNILRAGCISAITFYSARTARHFVDLIRNSALEDCFSSIKALCISANVVEYVRFLNWTSTDVAQSPDGQGMEELIRKHASVAQRSE